MKEKEINLDELNVENRKYNKTPTTTSIGKKIINFLTPNENQVGNKKSIPTAESAWIQTSYGRGSYRIDEKRIIEKQNYIVKQIEHKFVDYQENSNNHLRYSSYHCVIDIDEDLSHLTDIIFQPFIDQGYKIINLSELSDEIEDECVYLVSWKNAFKKYHTKKIKQ